MNDEKNKDSIVKEEPTYISVSSASGVSITASSDLSPVDKEFYFPDDTLVEDIVASIGADLNIVFPPNEKQEFISRVETVKKTYFSSLKIGFTWEAGFNFEIKREPKEKEIKVFKKEK